MDLYWDNSSNVNGNFCEIISQSFTGRILFPVYYIFLLIGGSCGNIVAIHLILKRTKKANSSDIYIINLAASDALFTLALPGRIVYYILQSNWFLGDWMCRLTAFFFYMNTYVGIYFITCVGVDRYIAVVHAVKYRKFRKARNAKYISLVVWCLAFIQTMPLLMKSMTQVIDNSVTCMEFHKFETIPNLPQLLLVACVLCYITPACVILVCYHQINLKLCRLLKESASVDRKQHFNKAFTVILVVLLTVILCFSPYHINIIQYMVRKLLYKPSCRDYMVFKRTLQITVALMNMNCCIDPIIYFFALKGYKKKIASMFRRNVSISTSPPERESLGGTLDIL
ncbi:LOW QUALITY PROTEIN: G-protein coupled receptor 183-like [Hyla sarda]|uniref:LOW QUALITY PROTEIN: G-protein coupled receptor 183-like n=1 Tax=Hyla sarda TaxID=327740 RepID=UPI0024C27D98|nr:LOW QUALITY PROTEIN: G-protein coupled receptor 183-like [Hyla sarda]